MIYKYNQVFCTGVEHFNVRNSYSFMDWGQLCQIFHPPTRNWNPLIKMIYKPNMPLFMRDVSVHVDGIALGFWKWCYDIKRMKNFSLLKFCHKECDWMKFGDKVGHTYKSVYSEQGSGGPRKLSLCLLCIMMLYIHS